MSTEKIRQAHKAAAESTKRAADRAIAAGAVQHKQDLKDLQDAAAQVPAPESANVQQAVSIGSKLEELGHLHKSGKRHHKRLRTYH